ncbi:GH25 family lysozyme [Kitasatospora sp. NPDC004745]|uniref:GH25 family lysozyme n=1 Tax=Kitasatospora sp. NPDC004745 TaxID=3364019 RepID=UPI00368AF8D0
MALARGYDVSDYQLSIPADAEFVFIKASEGARTNQKGYAAKVADARARGLVVGHYHFLHAENPVQGEIAHFCQVVGDVPAGELLVLDFEPYGQPVTDSQATAAKNAWLSAVKQRYPNSRVGLYTSVDWWRRTDDTAGDFLWIADYVTAGSPRIQAPWRFHQYSDSPLDSDVYNGTIDDLRAWAGAGAPSPAPVASPAASWPGLQLVTRDQWGARPWREPNGSIPYAGPRAGVKVHYLGEAYSFGTHDTCPAYVRKLQASHMDGNGWSDIGYSFVVCEHGFVFEGRGLTRRNSANGDVPLNEAHYAVCGLVGSSGSTVPAPEQLQGLRDAIEHCQQHGPAGPEIRGHRDGYSTDCPGGPLYAWVQAGAPRPTTPEDTMALTDDEINRIAEASARRTVYLLAQGLAGEAPAGADDNLKWLLDWYRQCSQSNAGAVLDYKLGTTGLTGLPAKVDAAPDVIAQRFAGGITLTVNTTPKGN